MFKSDLKQYLHFSSSKIFNILKFSNRIYFLPVIVIFPSNKCNFDCLICSYRKSNTRNIEIMDYSLMQKIINEASKFYFKPLLNFSGQGEPLIYPKILTTMQLCNELKMKWSITSNGYFLEKYAENLVSNNCYAINISIHGNSFESDKITGINGSFNKAINAIKKIEEIKKQQKKNTPLLAINCVLTDYNVSNLRKTLDTFLKLPVNSINFTHLHFSENDLKKYGNPTNESIIRKKRLNELTKFIYFIENTIFPIDVFFYPKIQEKDISGYYMDKNHKFNDKINNTCNFPWLSVFINPDGSVYCCSQKIGNIRTNSLKSIINSKKAIEFRNKIRKGIEPKPSNCFRCTHVQYY